MAFLGGVWVSDLPSLLLLSLFFLATTGYLSNTSKEAKGGEEEGGSRNHAEIRATFDNTKWLVQ